MQKLTTTDVNPKQGGPEVQLLVAKTETLTLKETTAAASRDGVVTTRRKVAKSLTSALTARSKAACGLVNKPRILNIDEADSANELAQVEYVEDIYKFYKDTEVP
ncbi:hypothetical protein QQ045_004209 [Rhodiola kirilowii]